MTKTSAPKIISLESFLQVIANHNEALQKFNLKSFAIFGSVARDEATENSDVDVLIEFATSATFDNYMDLKFLLEDIFDKPVDLVTRKSLKATIQQEVLDEAIYVPLH